MKFAMRIPFVGLRAIPTTAQLPDRPEYMQEKTAGMPDINWNDLRIVLAVWRGRTLIAGTFLRWWAGA